MAINLRSGLCEANTALSGTGTPASFIWTIRSQGNLPIGTNDYGTVVGFYDDNANAEHGFVTHGGQWATLDYPNSTITTELFGISNAGVIVGITGGPRSFIYVNGTFKLIKVPNSIATEARAITPSRLIAGRVKMSDGYHGFTATCH
jgi:hypothetical protein